MKKMGGRGAKSGISKSNVWDNNRIIQEQDIAYQNALNQVDSENAERDYVASVVNDWMNNPNSDNYLGEVVRNDGETETLYLEKISRKEAVEYIKSYNDDTLESDAMISVAYKDGSVVTGDKGIYYPPENAKLKTTGIKSVIVSGSWGDSIYGKTHIEYDRADKMDIQNETASGVRGTNGQAVVLKQFKNWGANWRVEFD